MPRKPLLLMIVFSASLACTLCASSYSKQVGREGNWKNSAQDSPDLEAARKLAEAQPQNAVAQNDYGWALRLHGEPAKGESFVKTAEQLDPTLAYVHSNLSVIELDLNKAPEALGEGKKAVELDGEQPIFHVVYGNALLANNDAKGAIAQYQDAIRQRADYENAYYNLGRAFDKNGQKNEALASLSKALELDSKDDRVLKLVDEISK
jgi:predicted Zn-dependent protease